jgi:hypothetical protein
MRACSWARKAPRQTRMPAGRSPPRRSWSRMHRRPADRWWSPSRRSRPAPTPAHRYGRISSSTFRASSPAASRREARLRDWLRVSYDEEEIPGERSHDRASKARCGIGVEWKFPGAVFGPRWPSAPPLPASSVSYRDAGACRYPARSCGRRRARWPPGPSGAKLSVRCRHSRRS